MYVLAIAITTKLTTEGTPHFSMQSLYENYGKCLLWQQRLTMSSVKDTGYPSISFCGPSNQSLL